ncbi:MAG: AMP-binding protein, partial [Gammaproteobacteria bacterium]
MIGSAADALCQWATKTPDRIFLSQPVAGGRREFSFAECEDICRRMASGLRELGLTPGDRVAILAKNCAEWFLADWATMMAGLVPVPIYPTAGPDTISYVMEHSESRAVFVGPLDNWQKQESGLDPDIPRIAMPYATMTCQHQWQDMIDNHAPVARLHRPAPTDMMSVLYTS